MIEKNYTLIISTLIILSLILIGFSSSVVNNEPYNKSYITDEKDISNHLVPEVSENDQVSRGGSRESYSETEPNNDHSAADTISNTNTPHTVSGSLLNRGDTDYFKIKLTGGSRPVDNLTLQLTDCDSPDWGTEYYSTIIISIWGVYEDEYLLMKAVSSRVRYWSECEIASIYAFDTDYYYIKLSSVCEYPWYNDEINYRFSLELDDGAKPPDTDQTKEYANKIVDNVNSQTLYTDIDIFDWYYIEAQDPETYGTNFSFIVDITNSKESKSEYFNNQMYYFVPEVHVLVYHWDAIWTSKDGEIVGNKYKKYDQQNPIRFHNHYDESTHLEFYIGIYVQTIGKTNNGEGNFVWGDGYCDGWVEYSIRQPNPKPMIPPILTDAKVQAPIGKIYDTFTYTVNYSDSNNDPPKKITILIDNGDIGPEPMTKVDDSDNNFKDGCIYKYTIDGSLYESDEEEHEYLIYAEDVERSAEGNVSLHGKKLIGPIVTNNILPYVRPSAAKKQIIYEDAPVSYLDLNSTFEDPDNDTLYYRLSNDNHDWNIVYNTENITIKVVDDTTDPLERNKLLEFRPKEDMFNRDPQQSFGSEIVYINVSDDNPKSPKFPNKDGKLSRAHYIWKPFELELILIGVNDPPQIRSSFYSYFKNAELELKEDHSKIGFDLNKIFWDPIEDDPLTFSVRESKNVDVIFYTNGTVDFIPKENWTGTEALEIIASDGQATVSDELKVKVTPVNDDPVLNYIPKQVIYEGQWFNITFIGYDDADSDIVYFETSLMNMLELTEDEYNFDPNTGELSFKPNNKNVGTYKDIQVTARDHNGGETTQYVVFEIKNSPDPPIPEISHPLDDARFLNTDSIDFQGSFYDPDDEILLEEHSSGWFSNIDGFLSSELNFRTTLSEGIHNITLIVTDPIANGSASINIRIVTKSDLDGDQDGIPDYWEILHFLNHKNPYDAEEDPDIDAYTNYEEYLGLDGKVNGNDDTDPWDQDDHPNKHFKESAIKKETQINSIAIFVIIIIILALIIIFIYIYRSRSKKSQEEADAKKSEEDQIWRDMYGRKYKVYKYEPIKIICHNCLEKLDIENPIRPLVIRCNKCGKRGVLYK